MSEKQINELLEEINIDEDGTGFIDCGTGTDYSDNNQYRRIIAAIKQNLELLQQKAELTEKLDATEKREAELLLQIESLLKNQLKTANDFNSLIHGIQEFLLEIYAGKENEVRIGDYIFSAKKDHIDFKYEPIKNIEPIKLEILISENSGKTNVCPICNKKIGQYPAISRKDNKTEICSNCGMLEALEAFNKANKEKENGQEEV